MIALPLSLRAVARLGGVALLLALLGWGLRVDHLRGTYKARLVLVTGKLVEVTQAFNGFRAEIVDVTERALAQDRARAADVRARNESIAREAERDYQTRIDDARARAERLRAQAGRASAGGGGRSAAHLSGAGTAAGSTDAAADQAGFSAGLTLDDALICTEQAIQLDALITWVERSRAAGVEGLAVEASVSPDAGAMQSP